MIKELVGILVCSIIVLITIVDGRWSDTQNFFMTTTTMFCIVWYISLTYEPNKLLRVFLFVLSIILTVLGIGALLYHFVMSDVQDVLILLSVIGSLIASVRMSVRWMRKKDTEATTITTN